jgi:hypothetical protein
MLASARAFFEHLIDYAGMFPPAKLPMDQALQNYTRYAAGPDTWMLGRFVCQIASLDQLESLIRSPVSGPVMTVTTLGQGAKQASLVRRSLEAELERIRAFGNDRRFLVDTIESLLPPNLEVGDAADIAAGSSMLELPTAEKRVFLEVPLSGAWPMEIYRVSILIADWHTPSARRWIGLKIRCGGTAIPTIDQLAQFLYCCTMNGLPWKATAGLHHPLRHRDTSGEMAHGFINVFGAGILARVHRLNVEQIAGILCEESADAFRFSEVGFAWRDWTCPVEQIREARQWMPSFGSCSFDEPRDDLLAMALID